LVLCALLVNINGNRGDKLVDVWFVLPVIMKPA